MAEVSLFKAAEQTNAIAHNLLRKGANNKGKVWSIDKPGGGVIRKDQKLNFLLEN